LPQHRFEPSLAVGFTVRVDAGEGAGNSPPIEPSAASFGS
jgi:hypothetical protein